MGLFAGIGGVERGLQSAGHTTELLCEIDGGAQAVLRRRFVDVDLVGDIRSVKGLPNVDVVSAGFPCQDLSQAGRTAGIQGRNSGLVGEVFRLVEGMKKGCQWLVLENVPFMLQLDGGRAMRYLTSCLEELGFMWAYRVVDARAFGLPQRRQRVLLVASRTHDPKEVLFTDDAGVPPVIAAREVACGFYWTEGLRGVGWADNAVPTLKGGSAVGIPSPPGIILPDGSVVVPDIRDAERLQGFPANWTLPAVTDAGMKPGSRWRLVGNAVSAPVARWLGRRLGSPRTCEHGEDEILQAGEKWPRAAWGQGGKVYRAEMSAWPVHYKYRDLAEFLRFPTRPLSKRATAGFLRRTESSSLRFRDGFLDRVREHLASFD